MHSTISVEFRKRKGKRKACENREQLTRLYAPPSYEVVIGMNDVEPPPYQSVADCTDTSDSEDKDSDTDTDSRAPTETKDTLLSQPDNNSLVSESRNSQKLSNGNINVTSAVVTCDIEGNHQVLCKSEANCDSTQDATDSFQELTKLHLCATGATDHSPNSSNRKVVVRGACNLLDDINEIEVLQTADTCSAGHTNGGSKTNNNYKKSNSSFGKGHTVKQNGIFEKNNGHAIKYKRSPSQIESIEFIDND